MKTNTSKTLVLFSCLFLICVGCSDDDKSTADKGVVADAAIDSGGSDSAVDGPTPDGPLSDGPGKDKQATLDKTPADLPPASTYKVVVTEFMANPTAVKDADGEWLELFNAGSAAVDISGWTLRDDDKDSHVITAGDAGAALTIAPGQYVVLAKSASSSTNGGVTALYQYKDIFLANSSDEIVLLDENGKLVDRVVYTSGWKISSGASLQLKDPSLDNNDPANWCTAATKWSGSAGDAGSPGAANVCAVTPDGGADMVIIDGGTVDSETGTGDAVPADTGTGDTATDTGTSDTGAADTGTSDLGVADTGTADAPPASG